MPRSFSATVVERPTRFYLLLCAGVLALIDVVVLFLIVFPPGGSRDTLSAQSQRLQTQIVAARAQAARLRKVSAKVQLGSNQTNSFQTKYILPRRTAYRSFIVEAQRLVKASGLTERDTTFSEDPIEGSADLTLVTSQANYQGSYSNLRKFLLELDHSPLLLMLDTLSATPQQKGDQINTSMRFQTIMEEDTAEGASGAP